MNVNHSTWDVVYRTICDRYRDSIDPKILRHFNCNFWERALRDILGLMAVALVLFALLLLMDGTSKWALATSLALFGVMAGLLAFLLYSHEQNRSLGTRNFTCLIQTILSHVPPEKLVGVFETDTVAVNFGRNNEMGIFAKDRKGELIDETNCPGLWWVDATGLAIELAENWRKKGCLRIDPHDPGNPLPIHAA